MPKQCNKENCGNPVFGGGYCRNHQFLRTDKTLKSLKRTPIRKISSKKQKSLGELKLTTLKDQEFFLEIWNERPHVCYETNEPIYGEPLTVYFHHVLEKEPYPQYRYEKWNIVILTWEAHSKCHNNIDHAPKVKAYRDQLLKKLYEL